DILKICLRIPGQEFDEPPTEDEALSFIRELGHSREIKYITDVIVDHLHQPCRTFASIINKCLCGKVSGLDKIRLSRVQILWGMYYKKNLDFVALIWEDLAYQIDNIDSKKQDKMFYPRFTKIIIHHFLKKDKSISLINRTFMHTARDDSLLGTMRFVSRHANTHVYGAIIPEAMTNQALLDSVAYKTYYAIAEESPLRILLPRRTTQLKEVAKRSKKDFHISHASGSGDGTDFESRVLDEQHHKTSGADEGTEEDNDDEDDIEDDEGNDDDNDDNYDNSDNDETDSDRTESDRINILVLNQSTTEYYEEEEEKVDDEEKMEK
ncbi:hypothetical protein Tco_1411503, partial [Tanacetum coccineum]